MRPKRALMASTAAESLATDGRDRGSVACGFGTFPGAGRQLCPAEGRGEKGKQDKRDKMAGEKRMGCPRSRIFCGDLPDAKGNGKVGEGLVGWRADMEKVNMHGFRYQGEG